MQIKYGRITNDKTNKACVEKIHLYNLINFSMKFQSLTSDKHFLPWQWFYGQQKKVMETSRLAQMLPVGSPTDQCIIPSVLAKSESTFEMSYPKLRETIL